jgi:hypothetical protein
MVIGEADMRSLAFGFANLDDRMREIANERPVPSHHARKIASEVVLVASAKVARHQRELERQEALAIPVFVLKQETRIHDQRHTSKRDRQGRA